LRAASPGIRASFRACSLSRLDRVGWRKSSGSSLLIDKPRYESPSADGGAKFMPRRTQSGVAAGTPFAAACVLTSFQEEIMRLQSIVPAMLAGLALSVGWVGAQGPALDETVSAPSGLPAPQAAPPSPAIGEAGNGTRYVSGGVSEEERQLMRELARSFPLRITSAEPPGSLVPGVDVAITDARGRRVMELADAGPLVYVMLPNGSYKVTVRNGDQIKTRQVSVAAGKQQELAFFW